MKLSSLSAAERVQLLRFVCSFVWADLEVGPAEKTFVLGLAQRMDLTDAEIGQVEAWLETPPLPEDVDPASIPAEHRKLFLEAAEDALRSDGTVSGPESENLALFRELLR